MADSEQVMNEYRSSLGYALPGARRQASTVANAFNAVKTALDGGAWQSSVADAFALECSSTITSASNAADDVVAALQAKYDGQPVQVDSTDRRAHWY